MLFTGQPSIEQWKQAARCGDRLEGVKAGVLTRCGVGEQTYNEYAIPLHESVDKVRAELRQSDYLLKPDEPVQYLRSVSGVYLHPDFVNFDMAAAANYDAFKADMAGDSECRMVKVCVLPDDDCLEKLTKSELTQRLTTAITSTYSGQERSMRLGDVKRAKTKSGLVALLRKMESDD